MPSYRYTREIKPEDLQDAPPPDYTTQQKAKNWWHYHWVWIVVGLIVAALVFFFVRDIVTRVEPDFTIGIMSPYTLSEDLQEKLRAGLAEHVEDLNGDGQVAVQIDVYTISTAASAGGAGASPSDDPLGVYTQEDTANQEDPYLQMAGITRLTAAFEDGNPVLFVLPADSAADYQQQFQLLGYPDGTEAPADVDIEEVTVAFGEVPGLARMDLTYALFDDTEVDAHLYLDDFRIGIRAITGTRLETQKGGPERWAYARELMERLMAAEQGEG